MSGCTHRTFENFAAAMSAVRLRHRQTGTRLRARTCRFCGSWRVVRVQGRRDRPSRYVNRSRRAA